MSLFKKDNYPQHLADDISLGKQVLIFFWEVFKVVVISLAIIIPVRYFLIKPFYVKGASMEPNLHDYEYLIIDEISYRFQEPKRGEIVVIKYPFSPNQHFIKRVVGLPGEKIHVTAGKVYIFNQDYPDGIELEENYLSPDVTTPGEVEVELSENEYYFLGDNRSASLDSRAFGPLTKDSIVGRTLLRGWPFDKFGFLNQEIDYNL